MYTSEKKRHVTWKSWKAQSFRSYGNIASVIKICKLFSMVWPDVLRL